MRFLWRWLKRAVLAVLLLALLLLAPVGYVEVACTGERDGTPYDPIITDANWQRAESRTLTTYPEWHIVHAYDDYARVIATGDPHDFAYLKAVTGFWTSLCPLKAEADGMGGMTGEQKTTIYTIGVSFTAELLAKAAYEETLGRLATIIRGGKRAALDDLSARQAADYAGFLQQTPWYKWDFGRDMNELENGGGDAFRDRERRFALGSEFRAKAAYARVIADAVEGIGADELRLRSVVTGLSETELAAFDGVTVIETRDTGILIETDRYRAFTRLLVDLAAAGAEIVEIAGNDEILFTVTTDAAHLEGALHSFTRQGYGDYRHLVVVPVSKLAARLRRYGPAIEHVHDY